jgi:hypothetical protein
MRLEVRWTDLSRRQIAARVTELGTPIGRHVASQLLREHRYRKRKAMKARTMGPRHPDRNAQFENIARLSVQFIPLRGVTPGWCRGPEPVEQARQRRRLGVRGDRHDPSPEGDIIGIIGRRVFPG